MYRELLPDRLKNLWESVEKGLLSSEEFHECQELYTLEYRREWHEKVAGPDKESVELFNYQSQGMLYQLMWRHTPIEDLSPLACVVALHFNRLHGCGNYLDFGPTIAAPASLGFTRVRHDRWRLGA